MDSRAAVGAGVVADGLILDCKEGVVEYLRTIYVVLMLMAMLGVRVQVPALRRKREIGKRSIFSPICFIFYFTPKDTGG